ncbi:MAG TPA: hypothetical protein VLA48_07900 [Nitrososphaeraceae archaeon]|nr:hypothetical protein [Nitrososphaeraceae archaeon]
MYNAIYNRQFTDIDGILDLEIVPIKGIKGVPQQIKEVDINNNTTNGGNITTFAKQELDKSTTTVPTTNEGDLGNDKDSAILSNTSSIPFSKSTIKTTTYGPNISAPITGTFHIEGPILVESNDYIIKVYIII